MDDNPSIISHVSVGVNDVARAAAFYDKVLATLGSKRIMEHEGFAIAYGKIFPEFWIQNPFDGGKAAPGNGVHVAFAAASQDQVMAFYDAALEAGGTSDGAPGPRPEYGEPYHGCFVRDPDGNKIEATYWGAEKSG